MTACHDTSSYETSTGGIAPLHFRRIVVGIDGSANSIEALRVAARLAVRDHARIEAVCAYRPYLQAQYPFAPAVPPYGPRGEGTADPYAESSTLDAAADAREILEHAVAQALGPEVLDKLVLRPVEGRAHDVLTRIAADADLLIVGAHGHSGPLGLLLGSTAQSCARHATCAVLVVPGKHHERIVG
jgi:nucleotide-binding universal stress UspA family protein